MIKADIFDFVTASDTEPTGYRCASTPETQERFSFLKTKRVDEVWQEGRAIYRRWTERRDGVPLRKYDTLTGLK
jgi:hypothetical protein